MNTIMNLLKWDITTNKLLYSLYALGVFGTFFAIMIFPLITGSGLYEKGFEGYVRTYASQNASIVVALMVLFNSIMLTMISAPYDGKQRRISLLMLPATMKQKFIERLFFVLVVVPVTLLVLAIASDLLHLVTGCVFMTLRANLHLHSYSLELFPLLLDLIGSSLFRDDILVTSLYIMYGIMCGSIWTKGTLLKSIGLGIAITMIFVVGMSVWEVLLAMLPESARVFYYDNISGILIFIDMLLVNVLMACIAYKVFVNRQVTEQKLRHMLMFWK